MIKRDGSTNVIRDAISLVHLSSALTLSTEMEFNRPILIEGRNGLTKICSPLQHP